MTLEKWNKLRFAEKMANIGSELNRAMHWHKLGEKDNAEKAMARVLELIDLTIFSSEWQTRFYELLRLREIICGLFLGKNEFKVSDGQLKKYFLDFALLPRTKRQ